MFQQHELRRCHVCWNERPITLFRRRKAGTEVRHFQCNVCRNRERRRLAKNKRNQRIHDFAKAVNERVDNCLALAALSQGMVRSFGGLDAFVGRWQEEVENARKAGKDYLVNRSMLAVLNLAVASSEVADAATLSDRLDDADLQRHLNTSLERLIRQRPEIAVATARRLGWEVRPLGESR